jgi:hypothetical protein
MTRTPPGDGEALGSPLRGATGIPLAVHARPHYRSLEPGRRRRT